LTIATLREDSRRGERPWISFLAYSPGQWREIRLGIAFALPAILVFLGLVIYPVVESIGLSFWATDLFARTQRFAGFGNYVAALSDGNLGAAALRDVVWTAGSVIGQMALGLAAALLVNRKTIGVAFVRQILLMPYVVPIITVVLVWRWMLESQFGVLSHWLQEVHVLPLGQSPLAIPTTAMGTVVMINIWRGFPFAMLIYWAALQSIDPQQYEAASVEGAGAWQSFRSVTLPNLREATMTLLVLRGIWTLTYFDLVWLTTQGGPAKATEIIPTFIYQVALGEFRFGYAAAIATLTGIVVLFFVSAYYVSHRRSALEA
jgi:multiple sugar transport system permease protein